MSEEFPYLIQLKHRNSIETWSSFSISDFTSSVFFVGYEDSYDFRTDDSKAFGDNIITVDVTPIRFAIYGGDINQDGTVDLSDLSLIDNDAFNFVSGYVITDMTGDNFTDLSDYALADNNAANFVSVVTP